MGQAVNRRIYASEAATMAKIPRFFFRHLFEFVTITLFKNSTSLSLAETEGTISIVASP